MISALTITDEQIMELRRTLDWDEDEATILVCDCALGVLSGVRIGHRRYNRGKAREKCAEILNERAVCT